MLKRLSATLVLLVVLTAPVLAGDVEMPGRTDPPPPPPPPPGAPLCITTLKEKVLLPIIIGLVVRR
jgi:hypothetical protein